MYKKKYGKVTVGAWLNNELSESNSTVMLLCGTMMALGGIFVRIFAGSPAKGLHALGIQEMVPPIWAMSLLWTLSFFTVGCAAGFVLAYRRPHSKEEKYKGCMLFLLLAFFEFLWYPTFFGSMLLFFSVLESLLILCLAVAVTFSFSKTSKFAGCICFFHIIWILYMVILNFSVFFKA